MLDDLDIQGEMICELIDEIFDIVDGSAVQYQCATVLYILGQLANQLNVCYTRNVQAPGQRKEDVDGIISGEKTYLDKIFARPGLHAEEDDNDTKASMHCMYCNGMKSSLAKMLYNILSNSKWKFCLHQNERKVMARRYHLRPVDEARLHNMKMKLIGFDNKMKQSGIGSYYCFRADPLLRPRIAAQRFYCSCASCINKLSLPTVAERYDKPFEQCKYWTLFKIYEHRRWNNVRILSFEPANGCDKNKREETFVATLRELGKTMARSVVIGDKGAYGVDANDTKYCLVEWTLDP